MLLSILATECHISVTNLTKMPKITLRKWMEKVKKKQGNERLAQLYYIYFMENLLLREAPKASATQP